LEFDYLVAFWLAVHKENTLVASYLMNWDSSIRNIAAIAIRGKSEIIS
jgi:hypothetical protein